MQPSRQKRQEHAFSIDEELRLRDEIEDMLAHEVRYLWRRTPFAATIADRARPSPCPKPSLCYSAACPLRTALRGGG